MLHTLVQINGLWGSPAGSRGGCGAPGISRGEKEAWDPVCSCAEATLAAMHQTSHWEGEKGSGDSTVVQ